MKTRDVSERTNMKQILPTLLFFLICVGSLIPVFADDSSGTVEVVESSPSELSVVNYPVFKTKYVIGKVEDVRFDSNVLGVIFNTGHLVAMIKLVNQWKYPVAVVVTYSVVEDNKSICQGDLTVPLIDHAEKELFIPVQLVSFVHHFVPAQNYTLNVMIQYSTEGHISTVKSEIVSVSVVVGTNWLIFRWIFLISLATVVIAIGVYIFNTFARASLRYGKESSIRRTTLHGRH